MRKRQEKFIGFCVTNFLIFAGLAGFTKNAPKEFKYGDFISEEKAYFGSKIDDPAGLIKAKKFVVPTDSKYSTQKTRSLGSSLIGDIESVWDSYTGKGTTVAVIDDGFDYNHPEYKRADGSSAILSTSRYYYLNSAQTACYYKEFSSDPTCIAEDWETDSSGSSWATHGTNTSTTAAAPINNVGGVGIAPEADILALKIDFSFASIQAAINYAIEQKVDVINMSLGAYAETFVDGWGDTQEGSSTAATYLNSVCKKAYQNNIIVVAAAGNESTYHKSYPACNTKVIGVGALGDYDNKGNANELAEFTNYVDPSQTGEINVDILAPGYVYTAEQSGTKTSISHSYGDTQGTSFSCPIVAGAACLWKEKYPSGTPDQFLEQLQSTADGIGDYANKYIKVSGWYPDLSDVGPSNITNGRLNVGKLLDIEKPFVSTVQSSLSISVGEKKQITLSTYDGSISYSSSNTSIATVSSTGLVEGVGTGDATITVTATKNGNTATATVEVHVASAVAATSISFNPTSVDLTVGQTYDAEATITVTPANASRMFLFESSNETVATVDIDTGLVTAIGEGSVIINAVPGYGEGSAELTVNVTKTAEPNIWKKITSQSDLSDGDYLIVYEGGNVAFNGGLTTLDAVSNTIGVTITNNTIPYNTATVAAKFTIASISGGYSIKSASGKYICGSFGSNVLNTGTNETANQITFDSGNAEIVSNTSHLRYNNASDQARFRYYKSASYSSQQVIQLYKASYDSGTANVPTVSEVTVSPTSLSLDVYSNPSSTLTASVKGTNSPAQTVTWSTTNSAVATVSDSGVVTAKGTGSAIIKATSTVDNSKYGSCTVTVTDSTPLTLSSISVSGQTTLFKVGDTFSFGGTVTAHFNNSTTSDVTSVATFSGYDMSTEGTQTVTVSYTYGSITKTTTYDITVSNTTTPSVTASTVKYSVDSTTSASVSEGTAPTGSSVLFNNTYTTKEQMTKNSSQTWKWTGYENTKISSIVIDMKRNSSSGSGTLTLTHNGSTITLGKTIRNGDLTATYTEYQILISEFEVEGDIELVINSTANSIYCDYVKITYSTIDNSDKIISSLSASYSGGSVFVGDSLDTSKVIVTATFTDSTKYPQEVLSSSKYSLTGFSSVTSGTKTVVVTYTGTLSTSSSPMTTSFNVEVIDDTVKDVKVTSSKAYHPGEVITKSDLTVTLTYESGKEETTSDYDFINDNYQFTYLDAPSGGSINTKNFSIKYNSNNYDFSVEVSRVAYQELPNTNKTLSSSQFSSSTISKSSSTESDTNVVIDEVKFTVTSNAYIYNYSSVSYLSFGKGAGSINNSEAFATDLTDIKISLRSGARTDGVLSISKDGINYVNYDSSLLAAGGYRFFKYEYTTSSSSTYSNISSISYTLKAADNPTNVSNYIMYEDTNGQCTTKLDVAIDKLNTMSNEDKATFWSSSDYVISTARERLQAWAAHEGRTLSYDEINHTYSMKNGLRLLSVNNMNINLLTIVLISLFTNVSVCSVLVIKRKKDN